MRKTMLLLSALTLVAGSSILWSADETSGSKNPSSQALPGNSATGSNPAANPNAAPAAPQATQTPPSDWTQLTGMVQAVDTSAKTVQIKDSSGNLMEVPVDRHVEIEKDGKSIKLSQVQMGDTITLAKKPSHAAEGTSAY